LFLHRVEKTRHRDLAIRIASRGTLTNVLNSLLQEGLIAREIEVNAKPIRSYYSITDRGRTVAEKLNEIKYIMIEQSSRVPKSRAGRGLI